MPFELFTALKHLHEALSTSAEKAQELQTEDGRRSQGELEASLAKAMRTREAFRDEARERAERNRRELKGLSLCHKPLAKAFRLGYLETLRNKTFQALLEDL